MCCPMHYCTRDVNTVFGPIHAYRGDKNEVCCPVHCRVGDTDSVLSGALLYKGQKYHVLPYALLNIGQSRSVSQLHCHTMDRDTVCYAWPQNAENTVYAEVFVLLCVLAHASLPCLLCNVKRAP